MLKTAALGTGLSRYSVLSKWSLSYLVCDNKVKYDFAAMDNLLFLAQFHVVFTVKIILTEEKILFIFFKFLVVNTDFFSFGLSVYTD